MRLIGRILFWASAATALFVLWLFAVWPPPVWYRSHFPRETAFMRMRAGETRGPGREDAAVYRPVALDSVAPVFVAAVLTGEDHRFRSHGGIDFVELRSALRAWRRGEKPRGASTITQQLAKNLYLSPSQNPLRKLKEAVTAYRLEAALGKERILELYVNVVELGEGLWGVEAASQHYFLRPARRLSREQAAALAGSLPFPLLSNPGYRPSRMRWRQQLILRRMGAVE